MNDRINQNCAVSEFPGLEVHLNWALGIADDKLEEVTSIMQQWPDPREGSAFFNRCESMAERKFALGFIFAFSGYEFLDISLGEGKTAPALAFADGEEYLLVPQLKLGGFRVDFALCPSGGAPRDGVVVEIDGHDWHERTKEQASGDRARDRALLTSGFRVCRYTGSDVQDPRKCALDAMSVVRHLEEMKQEAEYREWRLGWECGRRRGLEEADYRSVFYAGRRCQREINR